MSSIIPFFILLGVLIFIHELGHYLAARMCGVRVLTFSLGFGPKIIKFKRGETTYCISAIPLGGYVKMYGDNPLEAENVVESSASFIHKNVYQRFFVVAAGPLMNFALAVLLFGLIGITGITELKPIMGDLSENSEAFSFGFRPGDEVLSYNQEKVISWSHFEKLIKQSPSKSAEVRVKRQGGDTLELLKFDVPSKVKETAFEFKKMQGSIEGLHPYSQTASFRVIDKRSKLFVGNDAFLVHILEINNQKISNLRSFKSYIDGYLIENDKVDLKVKVAKQVQKGNKTVSREEEKNITVVLPADVSNYQSFISFLYLNPLDLVIGKVQKGSPALKAGLQSNDLLYSINGQRLLEWNDVIKVMATINNEESIKFEVLSGFEKKTLEITPKMTTLTDKDGLKVKRPTVGIIPAMMMSAPDIVKVKQGGVLSSLYYGWDQTLTWSKRMLVSFVRMFQSKVSTDQLGGILSIGQIAGASYKAGFSAFIQLMALLSVNLFILNLIPIPVLDGGHLFFYIIEMIKGSPVNQKKVLWAYQLGFFLLMFLMAFTFYNDIKKIFFSGW